MLKQERQDVILEILDNEERVIASDLSQRLDVSEDTIRRDLKELDSLGLIKRVHSGALRLGPPVQDFTKRQDVNKDIKIDLAKKAVTFIKDDMVLLIDSGTSNLAFVNQLPLNLKATVITNSPPIAMALGNHDDVEVIMLGGTMFKESMVNLGVETIEALTNIRADMYIMGVHKIDYSIGISVPSIGEASVKRKMIDVSNDVLSMVTSDKLNTFASHIIAPASVLTYMITNSKKDDVIAMYENQQVTVIR